MSSAGGKHSIIPGIQYLRGICAVMVVVCHSAGMMGLPEYFGSSPADLTGLGIFGVACFFAISGYIIVLVSLNERMEPVIGLSKYASRRFLRIVPFFWVCVIGYNVLSFAATGRLEWLDALKTLILWPAGELRPNVAWSLRHEFLFYALFAVSFLLGKRRPMILYTWFAAPLLFWGAVALFAPDLPQSGTPWFEYVATIVGGSNRGANVQFAIGFFVAVLWLRRQPATWKIGPVHLWVVSTVVGICYVYVGEIIGFTATVLASVLAIIPFVLALRVGENDGWFHKLNMELGNASFSIYLVHNVALLAMLEAASPFRDVIPQAVFFLVSIVVASAFGVVVHRLVEAPIINHLMRRPPQATADLVEPQQSEARVALKPVDARD